MKKKPSNFLLVSDFSPWSNFSLSLQLSRLAFMSARKSLRYFPSYPLNNQSTHANCTSNTYYHLRAPIIFWLVKTSANHRISGELTSPPQETFHMRHSFRKRTLILGLKCYVPLSNAQARAGRSYIKLRKQLCINLLEELHSKQR